MITFTGKYKFVSPQIKGVVSDEEEKPIIQFGVVSDIHVQAKGATTINMLSDIKEYSNTHILIVNGDLGDGTSLDYNTFQKLVATQNNLEIYYTIGNHEFYDAYINKKTNRWSPKTFPNGVSEQIPINRFLNLTGQPKVYYDKYISDYHFIFLGSEKSALSGSRIRHIYRANS
jgi:predicted MPP superfamily phosphohydrolase